jgi:hypothetical protein
MSFVGEISVPNEVDVYSVHLVPDKDYIALAVSYTEAGGAPEGLAALPTPKFAVIDPSTNTVIAEHSGFGGAIFAADYFRVPVEGDYWLAVGDLFGETGFYDAAIVDQAVQVELPGAAAGEYIVDPLTGQEQLIGPGEYLFLA